MSRQSAGSAFHKSRTLNDKYMLGDEIGKGAYGRVYKGLDLENGDFVAIKQVSLENIPPEDLASIMSEIDLLKNLNHKNIVKYQGSFKTKTHLYIILEFVENGSLANNIKPNKFGALPENVVGRYIGQVLEGLVYLHEQGVIHRDIKGANILTTKEGEVKLADFGVATKLTEADINTHSVVGTPYWMAPEVIEMSGVSAASDIWSVGCTVIELLTCVPPYYDLQPMPALFRIVQDDHPPLPEHIAEVITDFLRQCFQKDAKRRPDAKTLLNHVWIRKSRREKTNGRNGYIRSVSSEIPDASCEDSRSQDAGPTLEGRHVTADPLESGSDDGNSHSPTASYEVSSSQSSNPRAPLRLPSHGVAHFPRLPGSHDQDLLETSIPSNVKKITPTLTTPLTRPPPGLRVSEAGLSGTDEHAQNDSGMRSTSGKFTHLLPGQDDWEVNGASLTTELRTYIKDNPVTKPEANGNHGSTQAGKSSSVHPIKSTDDVGDGLDAAFFGAQEASMLALAAANHGLPPRGGSSLDTTYVKSKAKTAHKRAETECLLTTRPNGYESSVDTEDDDSVRTGLGVVIRAEGREYLAKQALEVSKLMAMMKPDETEEALLSSCQKLSSIFQEFPMQKKDLIMPHGIIPLMDMLDVNSNKIVYSVLEVLNLITDDNVELLESACHAGLIPILMNFASSDYSKEMRMQAAYFVQKLCNKSASTLQMFIACRGLPVLVGFLEYDYAKHREMVHLAIDGIWQILDLPGLSLKNDFCHIFARKGILARLVSTLCTLNEAARVRQHSSEKISVKSQDPSRVNINKEVIIRSRSGQLEQQTRAQTPPQNERGGEVQSKMQRGQAHRASSLPEFSWQLESGHLAHSQVASPPDRLSDHYPPGFGESAWVMGGDVCRRERDEESRSDGEARPLLGDDAWGSSRRLNGLVGASQHDQVLDRENALPIPHHSGVQRKMNGDLSQLAVGSSDIEKQSGAMEMSIIPPPKNVWLSPSRSARMNHKPLGGIPNTAETVVANTSNSSGVMHVRHGSASSSGRLFRLQSTLINPEVAQEYLGKVADLLLDFSRADTAVKAYMCDPPSLLQRLLQILNRLQPSILVKVLECIKQLSQDPYTLEYLQRAEAMKHLVPLLAVRNGPCVKQMHNQVLNALHNLCKINKRRQEQAAECGIIPHLMYFIKINSSLKQFALPLLCDMAHASRITRDKLRENKGLEVYLGLLDDEIWAVTALDSLAACLAHDTEPRKVEQALLQKEAVHRLVVFFQSCGGPSFVHILEPFLKIISKSVKLNTALAVSGLTPLLVARLEHQDAIARLTLLKLIKAVYEHHPRPKQLIVEHDLPAKLRRLIEQRRGGERLGGQVLVKQMANSLLSALHINTVL